MHDWNTLHAQLGALTVFRGLLHDGLLAKLYELFAPGRTAGEQVECYCAVAAQLLEEGENLTDSLLRRVLAHANVYARCRAAARPVSENLERCVRNELALLQRVAQLTSAEAKAHLAYDGFLPDWETRPVDFAAAYGERMRNLHCYGFGLFAEAHMFLASEEGLVPVRHPDPVCLADLKGYERQRKLVVDNTLALLSGRPAANVLLYGDAGTGKSSTVKAVVNAYRGRGLRLVEVPKKRIFSIPSLVEQLGEQPLCFLLFIDDLSFAGENEDFGALKAILEGSASARPSNVAIYATSNRRHLVKETFADRDGDDVHRNETLQEQASLSARFGLAVSFFQPDKAAYLSIVARLRDQYALSVPNDSLFLQAERFALQRGGRSPRVARQFIDSLRSACDAPLP